MFYAPPPPEVTDGNLWDMLLPIGAGRRPEDDCLLDWARSIKPTRMRSLAQLAHSGLEEEGRIKHPDHSCTAGPERAVIKVQPK